MVMRIRWYDAECITQYSRSRATLDATGRHCENIPTWISLCLTTVFSQQGGISVFKFPKRFSEFSWAKSSLYSLYFTLFYFIDPNHLKT
jgi:hypothetical protein